MSELLSGHGLSHIKIDKTREDVQRLHPLLQLLDPAQEAQTSEFAERLLNLLLELQKGQADNSRTQVRIGQTLDALNHRLARLEQSIEFLLGEVDPEQAG